jgi:hypothetical protein
VNCCTRGDLFGVIHERSGTPGLQILPVGRWGADQTDAKPGPVVSGDDPGPACLHLTPGRRHTGRNHWRTRWGTVRSVLVTTRGPPPSHGRVRPAQWDNEDVRRQPRLRPSSGPNPRAGSVRPATPIDLPPDLAQFGLTPRIRNVSKFQEANRISGRNGLIDFAWRRCRNIPIVLIWGCFGALPFGSLSRFATWVPLRTLASSAT